MKIGAIVVIAFGKQDKIVARAWGLIGCKIHRQQYIKIALLLIFDVVK
jgi:hypothetical protein